MPDLSAFELREALGDGPLALVSCLSFEDRSLAVAAEIASLNLTRWFCIENEDIETDITEMRQRAVGIAEQAGIEIEFLIASKRNPLLLADAMVAIADGIEGEAGVQWVADVTTMTHEMALVTVAAAEELIPTWSDLTFVYNVAGQYSGNDEVTQKWISRGIHEVRSVIGYPGAGSPGEPTALVALPGFDMERVARIVEEIEPERLLVGIAKPSKDRHEWSDERNRQIAHDLLGTRNGTVFEYPALDPFATVQAVVEITRDIVGNVLLAPLNSKISTVAVGVLAHLRPQWQVCYAPALIYNLSYATRSDGFLACTLGELRRHASASLGDVVDGNRF